MLRRVRRARPDEGFALITVLLGMVVVTLFLLASMAYAVNNMKPSRGDQDAKAALAAAQAGIEDYVNRLNTAPAATPYYYKNGQDPANPALSGGLADNGAATVNPAFTGGVPVSGTAGQGATYSYRQLTSRVEAGKTGVVRLQASGRSGTVQRDLAVTLKPDGFLRYVYFTDLESGDPARYLSDPAYVSVSVAPSNPYDKAGNRNLHTIYTYTAPDMVQAHCSKYHYDGRSTATFTSGTYYVDAQPMKGDQKDGPATGPQPRTATATETVTVRCLEVAFGGNDVVDGPAHSNDSLQVAGPVNFTKRVETGWGPGRVVPQPGDGKLWWNDKTVSTGTAPTYAPVQPMPPDNSQLLTAADPATAPDPNTGPGCVYKGQTSIRFSGTKMFVRSPGTTTSVPRCYDTSLTARNNVQERAIPSIIYVDDGPCGTVTDIGYPRLNEDTTGWTTAYNCSYGNAFVEGQLSGKVTVATRRDIVITANLTYAGGTTGTDALGLIPNGSAWVYHPVSDSKSTTCTPQPNCRYANLLTAAQTVTRIDAAILSVRHSFTVQNYKVGPALSTDPSLTLRVFGSIAQKHRGPVGSFPTPLSFTNPNNHGYLKDYRYDTRLLDSPPPFFLPPVGTSWRVKQVSD